MLRISAQYLAVALHDAAMELEPDFVVVGGGVTAYEPYLGIVRTTFFHLLPKKWTVMRRKTKVVFAQLGNDAGRVGGAAYAVQRLGLK